MRGREPLPPDTAEPKWRRYLRFWRRDPTADVDEELRFHLDSRIAEFVAAGMARDAAAREARMRFGDPEGVAKTLHDITLDREATMRRTAWMDTILQDLRYAARQLLRNPGFTAICVVTLALGIGANTAIFSVVYSVLLRPLPYANADRIYDLHERNGPQDTHGMVVTAGNFGVWASESKQFEALGAIGGGGFTLTGSGDPQQINGRHVSEGFWRAEYIPPVVGRYFVASEDRPGANHVAVLSYALWQTTFNGDRAIVGRSITLSGTPYTVVGVAPAEYTFGSQSPTVWVPLALTAADLAEHGDHELSVVGLLRPGVSPENAIAELSRIEARLAQEFPHSNFDGGIIARPLSDAVVGSVRPVLLMLAGAVGLVLLIACGNVTNLLLARAAVRHKELAIRGALGAGRGRIVGQLLAESLLLAIAGAIVGLGVAAAGVRFLVTKSPPGVPRLHDASLNAPVLLFTAVVAVVCSVLFGLLPALRATRFDLQQSLRAGGRDSSGGARERLRAMLIVAEVAVALVLLVGAGLLVRSAILLQAVSPGFDPHNLLVTATALPSTRYETDQAVAAAYQQIHAGVAAVPGVQAAALVSRIPIGGFGYDCGVAREGDPAGDSRVGANVRSATGNYFDVMRIPLLRGRTFMSTDLAESPPVAMINRNLARELFGDVDPIGKRITNCASGSKDHRIWREVVGITGDMHAHGLDSDVADEVYFPASQLVERGMSIVVRGSVAPASLTPGVRRAVNAVDPQLALSTVSTMDDIIARSLATSRFTTFLLLLLGVTGLVLATVGIYGVISYFVTQRSQEIGIRMALGADRRRVLTTVIREGVVLAAVGVAIGLGASALLTRFMATLLYGVTAHDPVTFAGVAVLLIAVAALASFVPARRATMVDPLAALRSA